MCVHLELLTCAHFQFTSVDLILPSQTSIRGELSFGELKMERKASSVAFSLVPVNDLLQFRGGLVVVRTCLLVFYTLCI